MRRAATGRGAGAVTMATVAAAVAATGDEAVAGAMGTTAGGGGGGDGGERRRLAGQALFLSPLSHTHTHTHPHTPHSLPACLLIAYIGGQVAAKGEL